MVPFICHSGNGKSIGLENTPAVVRVSWEKELNKREYTGDLGGYGTILQFDCGGYMNICQNSQK